MKKVLVKNTKRPLTNSQKDSYLKVMAAKLFSASTPFVEPLPPMSKRNAGR